MLKILVFLRLVDAETHVLSAPAIAAVLLCFWVAFKREIGPYEVTLFGIIAITYVGKAYSDSTRVQHDALSEDQIRQSMQTFKTELAELKTKVSQVAVASVMRPR